MINQRVRIGNLIESKYAGTKRGTAKYSEGMNRSKRATRAYKSYSSNIANYLGGRNKVAGNMKLINKKVSANVRLGLSAG